MRKSAGHSKHSISLAGIAVFGEWGRGEVQWMGCPVSALLREEVTRCIGWEGWGAVGGTLPACREEAAWFTAAATARK